MSPTKGAKPHNSTPYASYRDEPTDELRTIPRPNYENFTPRPIPAMSPSSKIHFHNTLSLFPYATTLAARVTMWA